MIKFQDIDTSTVKSSDIGRAHKAFQGSTAFYLVENSRNLLNADGSLVEYKVSWNKEKGFQCQCHAGLEGFIHCKKGICQHVILAVAAGREEKSALASIVAEIKTQATPVAIIDGKPATQAEITAIYTATPGKASNAKPQTSKAFSILR